jgi:MFS transporter, YNFM family, putative membrane transport protein
VAPLSPSLGVLVAIRVAQGFALAGVPAVAMAYLAEEVETSSLGRAMGLYIAGNAIGGLSGRVIAGGLAGHGGWRVATAGVGGVALAPFRLPTTVIGALFAVYLAGTYSSATAGRLADRFGRYPVLWAAVLITAGGVLLTLPASLPAIGAGMIVMTAGFFAAHSVASGWVGGRARVAPAQASALYLCLYYIGSSIAGSAGGVFYAHAGWPGTVLFVLALLAFALASALSLRR